MGQLIRRKDWGARPPSGSYSTVHATGLGTVHYTASPITRAGRKKASPPERPGKKWYELWRNPLTPVVQRRRISRLITAYNRGKAGAGGTVPASITAQERQIMRGFQSFHQGPARGWIDIGYHRVIFASGNIYEGRPRGVYGAHANGANDTIGYAFVMGDGDKPTAYMLAAFREQIARDGVTSYTGHRQRPGNSTSCPGAALTAALNL